MPRGKLCGEFITPECFPTLERLGVMEDMIAAGAQKIARVNLVVASGKSVQTDISSLSDQDSFAMSLSRARFDQILFERAKEIGATCLEGVAVNGCSFDARGGARRVDALSLKEGVKVSFEAPLILDASGRNSRLMIDKRERVAGRRGSRLYALKAHFAGIEGIEDQVSFISSHKATAVFLLWKGVWLTLLHSERTRFERRGRRSFNDRQANLDEQPFGARAVARGRTSRQMVQRRAPHLWTTATRARWRHCDRRCFRDDRPVYRHWNTNGPQNWRDGGRSHHQCDERNKNDVNAPKRPVPPTHARRRCWILCWRPIRISTKASFTIG